MSGTSLRCLGEGRVGSPCLETRGSLCRPPLLRLGRAGSGQTGPPPIHRTPPASLSGGFTVWGSGQRGRLPSAVAETEPVLGWNGGHRKCCSHGPESPTSHALGAQSGADVPCAAGQAHTYSRRTSRLSLPRFISDTVHPGPSSRRRVLGHGAGGWWHTASAPLPWGRPGARGGGPAVREALGSCHPRLAVPFPPSTAARLGPQ